MAKVTHVVVDSGGFIRNTQLQDIGKNIHTIRDVVSEIKDKATRQRLQVLPYELHFREPPPEAIKAVTDFSKKTGDYPSLSAVDLRVMALVYQLEKENVGVDHIKTVPDRKVTWTASRGHLEKPTEIAGFYLSKKEGSSRNQSRTASECPSEDPSLATQNIESKTTEKSCNVCERLQELSVTTDRPEGSLETECGSGSPRSPQGNEEMDLKSNTETCHVEIVEKGAEKSQIDQSDQGTDATISRDPEKQELLQEGDTLPTENLQEEESGDEYSGDEDDTDNDDDDDDDDGGWITPGNIQQVKASMGDVNMEQAVVQVGCVTTDFAMQNVLIQMGLNVVSVDGMLIKRAKSYVLRCFACSKVTTNMTREFCHHCGNKTLQKVSMTIDDDGNIQYFLSRRKPVSTRGMKFSLPKPQGGKHASNPVLFEDQHGAQRHLARASKVKYNVFDPDYVAHNSPFAPIDTESRSAQLGYRSHNHAFRNKRNPNENKKVYGRRK